MTNINKTAETAERLDVMLCSNIMREPQVFDIIGDEARAKGGPGVGGLCRDIMIWAAWNGSEWARLNVKEFAEMFGYSRAYLFKRLDDTVIKNLKKAGFDNIKDTLGYALAHLVTRNLVFKEGYTAVGEKGLESSTVYKAMNLLQSVTVTTSRAGTVFTIQVSKQFLDNCRNTKAKYFQRFYLEDYLRFTHSRGQAHNAARKMYMHLLRKRRVWDNAKKQQGVKPSYSDFDKLIRVAGFEYKEVRERARELKALLKMVGEAPGVKMTAELTPDADGSYTVRFKRDDL